MGCDASACVGWGASEVEPASDLLQVSLSVWSSHPHRWPSTRNQATPRGRRFPQASWGASCILRPAY